MQPLLKKVQDSPTLARVAPFALFLLLTSGQGQFGEASRYWIYLLKTIVGVGLIWLMRPVVPEMRWSFSWPAVAAGVGVFAAWVGLEGFYPTLDEIFRKFSSSPKPAAEVTPWNPFTQFAGNPALAWGFVLTRILGSTLIVPPLEETFYRSFVYRYIANPNFEQVPLNRFHATAFFVTAAIFGFAHREWLPGILCGMAYQGLVLRSGRLGEAMFAHAVTNFLLGVCVVSKGAWNFW